MLRLLFAKFRLISGFEAAISIGCGQKMLDIFADYMQH
jgi:hypothetical protein